MIHRRLIRPIPGILLCGAITAAAFGAEHVERDLFGRAWLEALVLAIVLGVAVRAFWTPGEHWHHGIETSAKLLLEIAVVLLGASVSAATVLAAGPALLAGIAGVVAAAIGASFVIGRMLGLPTRLATLVACGNSICGNSAIAAVAPVIGADGDDVAASIAFTAVLGVVVVLALPLAGIALGMTSLRFGALAGLTVYAVPQVIAAASPLGARAVQMGTLVKLVRVLMLGPVCVALSLIGDGGAKGARPPLRKLVPWFIVGFLLLVAARSFGLIPAPALAPIGGAATLLTVISMAALGLMTDLRAVTQAGGRVTMAVCLSLAVLIALALGLLAMLPLG
ncbi:MAG: YeiH family protein [Sphingomonas sp.]